LFVPAASVGLVGLLSGVGAHPLGRNDAAVDGTIGKMAPSGAELRTFLKKVRLKL
jgi:hypothetical protein